MHHGGRGQYSLLQGCGNMRKARLPTVVNAITSIDLLFDQVPLQLPMRITGWKGRFPWLVDLCPHSIEVLLY